MGREQTLLHDYFEYEAPLEPTLKGYVGTLGIHDIDALIRVLCVHCLRQSGVEGQCSSQDWELAAFANSFLK